MILFRPYHRSRSDLPSIKRAQSTIEMHNKYNRSKSQPAGSADYESHDDESEDDEDDGEMTETHDRKPLKVIIPASNTLSKITEVGLEVPFKSSPNMNIMLHSPEVLPSGASNVFEQAMGKRFLLQL